MQNRRWRRPAAGGRQREEDHGRLLERVAEAIVQVSSREIIPGSDGLLAEELRYTLVAGRVVGVAGRALQSAEADCCSPSAASPAAGLATEGCAVPCTRRPGRLNVLPHEVDVRQTAVKGAEEGIDGEERQGDRGSQSRREPEAVGLP